MFLTAPSFSAVIPDSHVDITYDIWNMIGGYLYLSAYGLLLVYW
jgi:hypothetical protein